jgi:hypothetical protein
VASTDPTTFDRLAARAFVPQPEPPDWRVALSRPEIQTLAQRVAAGL